MFRPIAIACLWSAVTIPGVGKGAEQEDAIAAMRKEVRVLREQLEIMERELAPLAIEAASQRWNLSAAGAEHSRQLAADPRIRLEEGEVLRFIPPGKQIEALEKLREERRAQGDARNRRRVSGGRGGRGMSRLGASPMSAKPGTKLWMILQPSGNFVRNTTYLEEPNCTVADTLKALFGKTNLPLYCTSGDTDVLQDPLPGDWITLRDPRRHREEIDPRKLAVVAAAMTDMLAGRWQLQIKTVDLPVYVATGSFDFQRIETSPPGLTSQSKKDAPVFWTPVSRGTAIHPTVDSFDRFLGIWGEILQTPIVDESSSRPDFRSMSIVCDQETEIVDRAEALTENDRNAVIYSFAMQSCLTLSEEIRPVEVLFITRHEED